MKTHSENLKMILLILIIGAIIVAFYGCCSTKKVYETKKTNIGDRVYYDFSKKQLYQDKTHQITIFRPLIVKENKEIQIEISKFNPLKYDVVVEDTSYDRFISNIENFSKFIKEPSPIELNTSNLTNDLPKEYRYNWRSLPPDDCDSIIMAIEEINGYNNMLNIDIERYKCYISYIENINNFYDYLKSYEFLTNAEIEAGIQSSIIDPINNYLPEEKKLRKLFLEVFKSDLSNCELYFYNNVTNLKPYLKSIKDRVDKLKMLKCKKVELQKTKFNKDYQIVLESMEEFESTRTTKILPNFTKTMLVYEKIQHLAKSEPTFVTKAYPINKDVQTINIFKYDQASKTKQLYDVINIQLTGGFRFDVSAGIFLSGLYDENYSMFSKDSIFTSKYIHSGNPRDTVIKDRFTAIYNNSSSKFSYGGMIFIHGHTQNATMLNGGGYLGLGALFNDQTRWSISGGGSLIIGRSQRCFINVGPVWSLVDRLTGPYKEDIFYQKTFDNIPIKRVWQCSWMFGASWKIGK